VVANLIFNPKALTAAVQAGPVFVRRKFGFERMIEETLKAYELEVVSNALSPTAALT